MAEPSGNSRTANAEPSSTSSSDRIPGGGSCLRGQSVSSTLSRARARGRRLQAPRTGPDAAATRGASSSTAARKRPPSTRGRLAKASPTPSTSAELTRLESRASPALCSSASRQPNERCSEAYCAHARSAWSAGKPATCTTGHIAGRQRSRPSRAATPRCRHPQGRGRPRRVPAGLTGRAETDGFPHFRGSIRSGPRGV
jgi:hypothetical protein